jgi:PAS domain S-box-containing protein
MSQISSVGCCPSCGASNEYTQLACESCGARLPWAAALEAVAQEAQARAHVEEFAKFRPLFDSDVVAAAFWRFDGEVIEANDAMLRMLGYTQDDLAAGRLNWKNLTPPQHSAGDLNALEQLRAGRRCVWLDKELRRADGELIPVLVGGALLPHVPDRGVSVALDISNLKATENALRISEAQYRGVFDATLDGLIICTTDGRVAELNRAMCEMHDLTREEAIGGPVVRFIAPGYEHTFYDAVAQITADENFVYRQRLRDQRRDGSTFPIEVTATTFQFGGRRHILGVIRDVSDREAAEAALHEQLSITQTITENAAEALFLMDGEGRTTYMNPAAESTFGWTLEEMRGRVLHDVLHFQHPDGSPFPIHECPLGGVIREGLTLRDYEDAFWHRDGHLIAVSCSNAPLLRDGKIVGAVLVVHDITERKRNEALRLSYERELRVAEERLRLATEAAAIGTWDWDTQTAQLTWSDRCKEIYGVPPHESVGYPGFFTLLHPLDRERVRIMAQQALDPSGNGEYKDEYRVLLPDGTTRWVAAQGRMIFQESAGTRQAVRFVGTAIDIDERKRSIDALQLLSAASATLASSLDHTASLQSLVDLAVPQYADFCIADLLDENGRQSEVYVANTDAQLAALMRELRQRVGFEPQRQVADSKVIKTGEPELCQEMTQELFEQHVSDPRAREIARILDVQSYIVVPLKARGRLLGTLMFCSTQPTMRYGQDDLHFAGEMADRVAYAVDNGRLFREAEAARLQAEAARLQAEAAQQNAEAAQKRAEAAQKVAEEANRAKDEFLATLSHELRTPLNAILGWASLLNAGGLDETMATRAAEVIERNVRVQAQLLNDLFDVSRIITGKLSLETKPITLLPVVEAAVDSVEASTKAKALEVKVLPSPEPLLVAGDAMRLQQVLWNLLSNAVRFTPTGGRIEVRLSRRDDEAQVEVVDSGQGIELPFLPYVFDRFRQADSSSTRRHGGMGLGLAIVRHLVEMHGGSVHADSDGPGQGSTFTVRLPLLISMMREAGSDSSAASAFLDAPQPLLQDVPPELLRDLKILLVDDEPDSLGLARDVLQRYGALVHTAGSAEEALEVLPSTRFDVLISDIAMPGEDGYSLLRKVRASLAGVQPELSAIALTALARATDRHAALAAGFQEHLTKPVEPVTLAVTVAALTGRL